MLPRLYTYIVATDRGFAPNPFWGYCTLACCKPAIRRKARKGDWVVGLTPRKSGNKLLYAMRVTDEPLSFEKYFKDKRFKKKKPRWFSCENQLCCGDNIYRRLRNGSFGQLPSWHSLPGGGRDKEQMRIDLRGERVLVSRDFFYFGSKPLSLPRKLNELIVGRGHKCNFSATTIANFDRFIRRKPRGRNSDPTDFMENPSPGCTSRRVRQNAEKMCK